MQAPKAILMAVVIRTATGDQVGVLGTMLMLETMWMSVVHAVARNHIEAQDLFSRQL